MIKYAAVPLFHLLPRKMQRVVQLILAASLLLPMSSNATESVCHGSVSNGRLEHGVKIPNVGANFTTYSTIGANMGRTHVHNRVHKVVLTAYEALRVSAPDKVFVIGETGWPNGGRIKPHRTHQNGLSVDFMVPVIDSTGRSIPLPTSAIDKFGYGIDFDNQGRFAELRIDFEAMAEHLHQIALAAKKEKVGVSLVIFDPTLLPFLWQTKHGPELRRTLPFMKRQAWVRHDDHYHIDFSIPCKPITIPSQQRPSPAKTQ